jgi:hypothetical protein
MVCSAELKDGTHPCGRSLWGEDNDVEHVSLKELDSDIELGAQVALDDALAEFKVIHRKERNGDAFYERLYNANSLTTMKSWDPSIAISKLLLDGQI